MKRTGCPSARTPSTRSWTRPCEILETSLEKNIICYPGCISSRSSPVVHGSRSSKSRCASSCKSQLKIRQLEKLQAPSCKLQAARLTGLRKKWIGTKLDKSSSIGYYRTYVKERSKNYNWRTEQTNQNAGAFNQPAGRRMHYGRQAGEGPGLHLQRVLCT